MIDKIKLLNEILENNPELEGKKESIKDLINILVDKNPEIKADSKFKKQLKDKIDTVIGMEDKSIRKLSIFTAFIQALSLAFIVGGFYYSFSQVDFFDKNKIGDINIPESIQLRKINPDIYDNSNTNNIEDTQIIKLLGEPGDQSPKNTRMMGKPMMMKSTMDIQVDTDTDPGISNFSEEEILFDEIEIFDEDINIFEQELSFEQYCFDNYGEILNIDSIKICIVEGKQCIEEDYKNGVCNFEQIK